MSGIMCYLCNKCANYIPEYDYGYNSEGDYQKIIGYNCFYDLPLAKSHCDKFEEEKEEE